MYIEDLLISLFSNANFNKFDKKMVSSFVDQLHDGHSLTEKQFNVIKKIFLRQKSKLNEITGTNIEQFINNPRFRLGLRVINQIKQIFIDVDSENKKVIKAQFPFDPLIIQSIKNFSHYELKISFKPRWEKEEKVWIFRLHEENLKFLSVFSKKFQFQICKDLEELFQQVESIKENLENYCPMVILENNRVKFKNSPFFIDNFRENDILGSLFLAREFGVDIWSEEINEFLLQSELDPAILEFLNSDPASIFQFHEKISISVLEKMLKYLTPCLIIIPTGEEFKLLSILVDFFKKLNIRNEEMTVLFRLSNQSHQDFNKFVKNQGLNNTLNKENKITFINEKLPKIIFESKINFKMIFCFDVYHPHYTIKNLIKNHQNVIAFSPNIFLKDDYVAGM